MDYFLTFMMLIVSLCYQAKISLLKQHLKERDLKVNHLTNENNKLHMALSDIHRECREIVTYCKEQVNQNVK